MRLKSVDWPIVAGRRMPDIVVIIRAVVPCVVDIGTPIPLFVALSVSSAPRGVSLPNPSLDYLPVSSIW